MRLLSLSCVGVLLASVLTTSPTHASYGVLIQGTVTHADSGDPIAGVRVFGRDAASPSQTDAQGRFEILLTPGSNVVYADFERTEVSDTEATGSYVETPNLAPIKKPVTILASGNPELDLEMSEGAIFQGTLKTPAGVDFSTRLTLNYTGLDGGIGGVAAQRSPGQFVIPGLLTGQYALEAQWCVEPDGNTHCEKRSLGSFKVTQGKTSTTNRAFLMVHKRSTRTKLTGTLKVGKTIKSLNHWYVLPEQRSYRWYRDGRAIGGATKARYTIKRKDVGHRLSVRVTGTDTFFATKRIWSNTSAKVKK
jgi:hypothetical protein